MFWTGYEEKRSVVFTMEEPVTVPAIAAPGKAAPLPQPWEERTSQSTGDKYYFNPQTNESTYERPKGKPATTMSSSRDARALISCRCLCKF